MEKSVPYIVFESSEARHERMQKRLVIALVLSIVLLFASNGLWLWHESQYDYSDESYVDQKIKIHDCKFIDITGTASAISMQSGFDIDIYNNTFINCTSGVRQCQYSAYPTTVHGNRFINCTTPYPTYASAYVKAYNNMINGTFTA